VSDVVSDVAKILNYGQSVDRTPPQGIVESSHVGSP